MGARRCRLLVRLETKRFLTLGVHLNDLPSAFHGNDNKIDCHAAVGAVGNGAGEDIRFEEIVGGVRRLQRATAFGQATSRLHVGVHLIVQTALEFGTLSGEFLRIGSDVLEAGSSGADGTEVLHPRRTTQFSAARTDAADAAGFLTRTNLFHFNADMEGIGKNLDEFAEIDTTVGNVVENGFVAVALILDIADFHLKLKVFGDLASTQHGVILSRLGLVILLHVGRTCLAIDTTNLGAGLEICLLHLQQDETAGQRDNADVVTGLRLDSHNVALDEVKVIIVAIEPLARVLELNFNIVGRIQIAGNARQIVIDVQLVVASAATAGIKGGKIFVPPTNMGATTTGKAQALGVVRLDFCRRALRSRKRSSVFQSLRKRSVGRIMRILIHELKNISF